LKAVFQALMAVRPDLAGFFKINN